MKKHFIKPVIKNDLRLGNPDMRAVIDIETTGFSKANNGLIEICVAVIDKEYKIVEMFETLVKPHPKYSIDPVKYTPQSQEEFERFMKDPSIYDEFLIEYEESAEKVHGISKEEAKKKGMPIDKVCYKIDEMLFKHRCRIAVAHNISFEKSWTDAIWTRNSGENSLNVDEWLCTMKLAKKNGHSKTNLRDLCKKFGILNKAEHRAGGDVIATINLLKALENEHKGSRN